MKSLLVWILIAFGALCLTPANAGSIDFDRAKNATSEITKVSVKEKSWDTEVQIKEFSTNIFHTIKIILGGLLVVYLVYSGTMMIFAMGSDDKLSSAKRWVWYAILWLLFVNIPWSLFDAFWGTEKKFENSTSGFTSDSDWNIFINSAEFGDTLGSILTFIEVLVIVFAVIMIILSGLKLIFSQGKDEGMTEAKNRILYSILALIFMGVIVVWKNIMFTGEFTTTGKNFFSQLANLALLFAAPIAIFFLCLAGWYFITAWGSDDRVKKAKSIIINTLLASLILIGMYTFFWDLWSTVGELGK